MQTYARMATVVRAKVILRWSRLAGREVEGWTTQMDMTRDLTKLLLPVKGGRQCLGGVNRRVVAAARLSVGLTHRMEQDGAPGPGPGEPSIRCGQSLIGHFTPVQVRAGAQKNLGRLFPCLSFRQRLRCVGK